MNARQRKKLRRKLAKPTTIGGIAVATKFPDWTYKYLPCSKNEDDLFRLQMSEHVQRCLDRFHAVIYEGLYSDFKKKAPRP